MKLTPLLWSLVQEVINDGVIEPSVPGEQGEFVSPLMHVTKWDGGWHLILNLKNLNEKFVRHIHFKLEGLESSLKLIRKNAYMCTLDLSQAFHAVALDITSKKYTKFVLRSGSDEFWFQYCSLPMGHSHSPYLFTKITSVIKQFLQKRRVTLSMYLDDVWIWGASEKECWQSCLLTRSVLES